MPNYQLLVNPNTGESEVLPINPYDIMNQIVVKGTVRQWSRFCYISDNKELLEKFAKVWKTMWEEQ